VRSIYSVGGDQTGCRYRLPLNEIAVASQLKNHVEGTVKNQDGEDQADLNHHEPAFERGTAQEHSYILPHLAPGLRVGGAKRTVPGVASCRRLDGPSSSLIPEELFGIALPLYFLYQLAESRVVTDGVEVAVVQRPLAVGESMFDTGGETIDGVVDSSGE
jgi:hypothetical protein